MVEKPVDRDELLQVARRGLMGRGELWHTPVAAGPESVVLQLNLTGFAEALQEHRIALGRGGLCVESRPALHEESVGLLVEFRNDKGQMQGQGIVRWVAPAEELAGIELLYLDAPNSALVADIAERTEFAAFIPASLSKEHAAAKSA
jgi:hypothetical protein